MKTYNIEIRERDTDKLIEIVAENVSAYVAERTFYTLFSEMLYTPYYLVTPQN